MAEERARRWKQPGEVRTLTFDFLTKLSENDSLVGSATFATPALESGTSTPAVTGANVTRIGNQVSVRLSGGADGSNWGLQMACGTQNGDTLHLDALLEIREKRN